MSLASKIAETFEKGEVLSQEHVEALVQESIQFMNELKARLSSTEDGVREAALKDAKKLQDELKVQMEKMAAAIPIKDGPIEGAQAGSHADMLAKSLQTLEKGLADRPKQSKPKYVKAWLAS